VYRLLYLIIKLLINNKQIDNTCTLQTV